MNEKLFVMGWIDLNNNFTQVPLNSVREDALVARIKKRKYNFTHFTHQFLTAIPLFNDGTYCLLTKSELDKVFEKAHKNIEIDGRKMPLDEEECVMYNGILFEKQKFLDKYKENGNICIN
jgi:hypothetical protein